MSKPTAPGWYWATRKINDQVGIVEVVEVVENHWRELRVWAMRYEQSEPLSRFTDWQRIEDPRQPDPCTDCGGDARTCMCGWE